jgi:hypothetical protein
MAHDVDGLIITITDVRRIGYCAYGARRWFRAHGLNFREFIEHGIPAERLLATGDALAQRVVDEKLRRQREQASA